MNLKNLFDGQIIHNYKELCALLDIEEKTGNAKKAQFRELERYFKFKKNGHSILVEEVYELTMEKIDGRKLGNRSIYVDDISIQLLDHIARNKRKAIQVGDTKRMFLTANEIFSITGMINDKYIPTKQSIKAFVEETPGSLEIKDLTEFFQRTEGKMRQILLSALKNLKSRYVIIYENRHKIQENSKWRLATEREEEKIIDIKNSIIGQMGLRHSGEVYFQGRSGEFHTKVNNQLLKQFRWTGAYSGFLIGYGEQLEPTLKSYKKEFDELIALRYSLNGKFATFANKEAENRYLNNKKEYEEALEQLYQMAEECWGEPSQIGIEYPKNHYKDNWIDNQFFLTDELIKLPKKKPTSPKG